MLTSAPASASACLHACLRARAQFRNGWRWRIQPRELRVSAPIVAKRVGLIFWTGMTVVTSAEDVRAPTSVSRSLTLSPPHTFDGGGGYSYTSGCVRAFVRVRAQLRHGGRWLLQHGERGVSPPSRRSVLTCVFFRGEAGTEGVRAPPSVGRSLTLSPPNVFDVGAGACVCLCACMPACACAVPPRSAVANPTSRAASECPHRG